MSDPTIPISGLSELAEAPAATDEFPFVDVSAGLTKKITVGWLLAEHPARAGGTTATAARVPYRNVSDFTGADPTGVADSTAAILAALADVSAGGEVVAEGVFRYTASLIVTGRRSLRGIGYTDLSGSGERAGTCLLKDGNFDGVILERACQLRNLQVDGAAGNGGDGVYLRGGQRALVEDVAVTAQGGNGFSIGAKVADGSLNTNLWRARNLIAVGNTGHGLYINDHKSATSPDANAGVCLGLDARSNGGDGLRIGQSIDCQFFGLHLATNTGRGFHLEAAAEGHYLWAPYTESNTAGEGLLATGSRDNVVFGPRSNVGSSGWTDSGTNNLVLSRGPTNFQWQSQLQIGSTLFAPRLELDLSTSGSGYLQMIEQTADPSAPAANKSRTFTRDNGSGKTQLCVLFPTGAVQVLATEP